LLEQRCWVEGVDDQAGHALNVALMTAAMLHESQIPEEFCVDAAAAALLHDIGQVFLPEAIRGIPAPLLDERGQKFYRYHPFLGARALLLAGCPALWIAAAFGHHKGVDGGGYPELDVPLASHEAVRVIALASFVDKKRTVLPAGADGPEIALGKALALADRYFDRAAIRLFLRALGVFPPGTTVELSDRSVAVVTRANSGDPVRPEISFLFGPNAGKVTSLREFNVMDRRFTRSIARAVSTPIAMTAEAEDDAAERSITR
jgi:hypothetical protein